MIVLAALVSTTASAQSPALSSSAPTAPAPAIRAPVPLNEPDLVYPKDAFMEAVDGLVTVAIELDAHGDVARVVVEDAGDPRLAWAALGAATTLRFEPAVAVDADGSTHPIAVRFLYTFTFAIDEVERQHLLAHDDDDVVIPHDDDHVPPPVVVTGTVLINDEEGGVAGAIISVDGDDDDANAVESDIDGHFALRGLPPGPVVLLIDAAGFALGHVELEVGGKNEVTDVIVYLERRHDDHDHETVVKGRHLRREVTKRTLTQSVAVLDQEALARVRGRTLAGTISEVPGVTMVQSSPSVQKPVVRGQFGRRLLLITDGVRLESQDWGIDHAPEFDPAGAGEISIVKGAAGVRFGADAIGGVIVVEPRPMLEDVGVDADLNMFGVDNGYVFGGGGRVDVVVPQLPSMTFRLEGSGSKGAAASAPDYVLGNTATEIANIGATAVWRGEVFERAVTAQLSFRHHQSTLGICYCLNVSTPDDLRATVAASRPVSADAWRVTYDLDRPRQQVSHDTAIARVGVDLGALGELSATYAFQLDLRDEFDSARRSVTGPQLSFALATNAVDVLYTHPTLSLGGMSVRGQAGTRADIQTHAYEGLQLIPNFQRSTAGLFGLETLRIDDVGGVFDLEVLVGARVDGLLQRSFLSGRAFDAQLRRGRIAESDCERKDDVARCDAAFPALSVTTGTRLHFDLGSFQAGAHPAARQSVNTLVLSADVSSATRFPDVDELYLGGRAPSFPVFAVGDAGLGPERTVQLSMGAELSLGPLLHVEGGIFASHISDYINFGPELNDSGAPIVDVLITGAYPRFSYQAVDAMISGVDGVVVLAPGQLVSASAQVAVVQGLNLSQGSFLPFMPPPQARFEVRSHLPDAPGLGMSAATVASSVVVVARQDRSDARSDFVPPADGYALWNANANVTVDAFGSPVDLGLEVRNILNRAYRDQLSLMRFFADQPGREVWLRINVHFGHAAPHPPPQSSTEAVRPR
jgi:iron complex outermembrane receptor protein